MVNNNRTGNKLIVIGNPVHAHQYDLYQYVINGMCETAWIVPLYLGTDVTSSTEWNQAISIEHPPSYLFQSLPAKHDYMYEILKEDNPHEECYGGDHYSLPKELNDKERKRKKAKRKQQRKSRKLNR